MKNLLIFYQNHAGILTLNLPFIGDENLHTVAVIH